ncbi:hypothetical protein CC78DRAFT_564536 [Lojkania enalia]|uniref:Uncharacterized protein n=1 Tax=Lojkania enalia TaxID=147567 RepID=A0A9P4TQR3_9PLEO|nr:hypothetical protein CC78DRAFT_564536 [Didymosphaeria enalia]
MYIRHAVEEGGGLKITDMKALVVTATMKCLHSLSRSTVPRRPAPWRGLSLWCVWVGFTERGPSNEPAFYPGWPRGTVCFWDRIRQPGSRSGLGLEAPKKQKWTVVGGREGSWRRRRRARGVVLTRPGSIAAWTGGSGSDAYKPLDRRAGRAPSQRASMKRPPGACPARQRVRGSDMLQPARSGTRGTVIDAGDVSVLVGRYTPRHIAYPGEERRGLQQQRRRRRQRQIDKRGMNGCRRQREADRRQDRRIENAGCRSSVVGRRVAAHSNNNILRVQ